MTRVGAVGFLNARPLYEGLCRHPGIVLREDVPSVCARLLHAGDIDLGLVPVIELLRGDTAYAVAPGLAIGCDGAVNSVALFTHRPLAQVRRIALDVNSRSSVGLVRVLCRHHFGIAPEFVDAPPHLPAMLEAADAALLIGDPALQAPFEAVGATKIDLGSAWKDFTGLPFVFAVWAARPGVLTPDILADLHAARRAGEAAIPRLAAAEAGGDPTRAAVLERYLRRNIRYDLDEAALRGLTRYLALAVHDGLAHDRPEALRAIEALRPAPPTGARAGETLAGR